MDELIAMFEDMGVSVGGGETNGAAAKGDMEREEESESSSSFDEDLGRTDDPRAHVFARDGDDRAALA